MIDKKVWGGLKRKLSNISLGITGKRFNIIDIPHGSDDLAYTAKGKAIYINPTHQLMDGMSSVETTMFIEGLFAHELMHQLATDFPYFEIFLDRLPKFQQQIFATIFNVIEDPSIENLAPQYFGGHLLNALSFAIMYCYKNSCEFSQMSPFSQFVNALIHYGDGGLLKSEFTSDEAKECFLKAVTIVDKAIEEPNGRKRIELSHEIFVMSRPLWEPYAQAAEKEMLLEELKELLQSCGKGTSGTNEGPQGQNSQNENSNSSNSNSAKSNRRKLTVVRLTEEDANEKGITPTDEANSDESAGETGVVVIEEAGSNPSYQAANSPVEQDTSQSCEASPGLEDEENTNQFSSQCSENQNDRIGDKLTAKTEGTDEISEKEYEISSEDAKKIEETIEECKKIFESEEREETSAFTEALEVPEINSYYTGVSCSNIKVRISEEAIPEISAYYNEYVGMMVGNIGIATQQLKRLFKNDNEEKERRSSGRLNVKQLSSGRMTPYVFDRRRAKSDKSNIAILILFDESGSMHGNKIGCARMSAIGLAEVFRKLNIPISIIGFTGDTCCYDVEHYHYITWHNTPLERYSLVTMSARDCNFDGYSIRYATELLKKRPEEHKLLIICSDGRPNSDYYQSGAEGIKDTADAIKQASKSVDVLGVGIGTSDTDVLYSMYKNNFLLCDRPDELFGKLSGKIKKIVSQWD